LQLASSQLEIDLSVHPGQFSSQCLTTTPLSNRAPSERKYRQLLVLCDGNGAILLSHGLLHVLPGKLDQLQVIMVVELIHKQVRTYEEQCAFAVTHVFD
jgi:hypothetical protein